MGNSRVVLRPHNFLFIYSMTNLSVGIATKNAYNVSMLFAIDCVLIRKKRRQYEIPTRSDIGKNLGPGTTGAKIHSCLLIFGRAGTLSEKKVSTNKKLNSEITVYKHVVVVLPARCQKNNAWTTDEHVVNEISSKYTTTHNIREIRLNVRSHGSASRGQ